MSRELDDEARVRLERDVLRAMCQGGAEGSVREPAIALFKDYRWREPVHEAIFASLAELPTQNAEVLRRHLPERLTRRGFPDIEWNDFFAPHSLSGHEAERLMRRLLDLG